MEADSGTSLMGLNAYIARKRLRYLGKRIARKIRRSTIGDPIFVPAMPMAIPRQIWAYWDTGLADAPEIVRFCIESWRKHNPDWTITVLDAQSAGEHCAMPDLPAAIGKAHFADVLRTRLLATHGGVWADATALCDRPLNDWLPIAGQAGFFVHSWGKGDRAFTRLAPDRILGNWFIAANRENMLIREWDRLSCEYWQGRSRTKDYFWHNDIVEHLIATNADCARIWERMPKMSALPPHLLYDAIENARDSEQVRQALAIHAIPVHKLSWRMQAPTEKIRQLLS